MVWHRINEDRAGNQLDYSDFLLRMRWKAYQYKMSPKVREELPTDLTTSHLHEREWLGSCNYRVEDGLIEGWNKGVVVDADPSNCVASTQEDCIRAISSQRHKGGSPKRKNKYNRQKNATLQAVTTQHFRKNSV